jgi:hypothetical protein
VRLALANVLALVAYVGVIWFCFAFIMGFATNSAAPWGFTVKLNNESFGFALIYMMFIAPIALLVMLIYFIAFRAGALAIAALVAVAVMLSIAFMSPWLHLPGWPGGNGNLDVRWWIMIVWASVTAALAHHVVFAFFRPRGY